jgi:hypothetical protein
MLMLISMFLLCESDNQMTRIPDLELFSRCNNLHPINDY